MVHSYLVDTRILCPVTHMEYDVLLVLQPKLLLVLWEPDMNPMTHQLLQHFNGLVNE